MNPPPPLGHTDACAHKLRVDEYKTWQYWQVPGWPGLRPPLRGVGIHNDPVRFYPMCIERLWHIKLSQRDEEQPLSAHICASKDLSMDGGEGLGMRGEMDQRGEEARKRGGGKGQSAWQRSVIHAPATGHRRFQKHFCSHGLVTGLLTNSKIVELQYSMSSSWKSFMTIFSVLNIGVL